MHVSHWDWRTRLHINYGDLFKVRVLICFCASSGPFSSLAFPGPGEHTFIRTALLATSYVPLNHKTSEQAILYKGQQHLLEMITLLLFHLLKFKIAIYDSTWKTWNSLSQLCVCAHGKALHVYGTQRGIFCVPPKSPHLCKSKEETRKVGVRETRVSTLAMKSNGVSEVSVLGKALFSPGGGPALQQCRRQFTHSGSEAT